MRDTTVGAYETMQESEKLLRKLFTDAGIAFDDDVMLPLINAMADCFIAKPAYWYAFNEVLQAPRKDVAAGEPENLDDQVVDVLGKRFKTALLCKGGAANMLPSQLYWFGMMAAISIKYPQVNAIVTSVVNHQLFGIEIAASLLSSRVH